MVIILIYFLQKKDYLQRGTGGLIYVVGKISQSFALEIKQYLKKLFFAQQKLSKIAFFYKYSSVVRFYNLICCFKICSFMILLIIEATTQRQANNCHELFTSVRAGFNRCGENVPKKWPQLE